MNEIGQTAAFAYRLYRDRAATAYAAYVQGNPLALLRSRPGRVNPYAIYERIRANGTLSATRAGTLVSPSHRVCSAVLRDRRFGVRLDQNGASDAQVEFDLSFLGMNPPQHTRLRRLAQPAFSPKAVAGYRGRIERTVDDLLDRASASGRFDLVSAFAAPLPIAVITDLLGVPNADVGAFAEYGAQLGSALDGVRSLGHAARLSASGARLEALFQQLFELRRREPRDDIISMLLTAEGDRIEPAELLPLCFLLLVAGFETTVNLIGNCVLALLQNPAQWEALCADPHALAPKAVEEALRYDPPVQRTERIALEPLELEDRDVPTGSVVVTLIGAANRDPEAYQNPGAFDIHRGPSAEHLAFSAGIHYCLGQPLARLEAEIAIARLAERMPALARAAAVQRRNSTTIRGPVHMPLTTGTAPAQRTQSLTSR